MAASRERSWQIWVSQELGGNDGLVGSVRKRSLKGTVVEPEVQESWLIFVVPAVLERLGGCESSTGFGVQYANRFESMRIIREIHDVHP